MAPMIIPGADFDALSCTEEYFENGELKQRESCITSNPNNYLYQISFNQDPILEQEEISYLLCKESEQKIKQPRNECFEPETFISRARTEAVNLILIVSSQYAFSALTSLLAVNYIDRLISGDDQFWMNQDEPWTPQLAALTCLSIAVKMEEVEHPHLVDLQVVSGGKYIFHLETIHQTEILILQALQWRMNPVTPISFLEYIVRIFGLKDYLCVEFLRRCELTLLSLVLDCRFMLYLPSVMAAAAALHVVNYVALPLTSECTNHLLRSLKIDQEKLDECCQLITEMESSSRLFRYRKRKSGALPASPYDVMDMSCSSPSSSSSSVNSSPEPKKRKIDDKDHDDASSD